MSGDRVARAAARSPRPGRGLRRAAALALLALPACGRGDGASPAAEPAPELGPVLADALERLGPLLAPEPAPSPEEVEELAGLATLASGDPSLLAVAREDARGIAGAADALARIAREPGRSDAERAAAVDLVPQETVAGALALAALARDPDRALPAWMRARAAWRLCEGSHDACVPDLVLPLKYETDHEAVVWIASALARHAIYAGIDGLIAISGVADSPAKAAADAEIARELAELGLASASDLWRAWHGGDPDRVLPRPERSDAFRAAVWRWIDRMDEFQLRGVDDARFVLERLGPTAAEALGEALFDRSVYVRVHAAQALQRMGPRGAAAGPALAGALLEPEVAPHAAKALGDVRHVPAADALLARLSRDTAPGLRLASARALGHLGEPRALPALRALYDEGSAELAQAAAESVLRLAPEGPDAADAVQRLCALLSDRRVEPASSERALRAWLYERGWDEALERWDALEPPPQTVETPEEAAERRARRAELVREKLSP